MTILRPFGPIVQVIHKSREYSLALELVHIWY